MSIANGTYFDGQVACGHPVSIEFGPDAIVRIRGLEFTRELELAAVGVSDRLGDITRYLYLPDGAVIETLDNAIVDAALADRRRSRGAQLIHVLESQQWLAVVGCFILVAAIVALAFYGPPTLARAVAKRVPTDIDQRIGDAALTSIRPYFAASTLGSNDRERVEKQLSRLVTAGPTLPHPRIEFLSMQGGLPNAFALPGNVIVVTDELVRLPATDDEIAAVLAHELGHLDRRHGLQSLLRKSSAVLLVAAVTGDMSTLTSFASALPLSILTAGYSRDFEGEADRYALDLLRARKIAPRAFVTVLVKLEASRDSLHRQSTYLSTHPASEDRMALFGGITPAERNAVLAEPWLTQAIEATARDDLASAIADYDKAIKLAPTASAYLSRARCRRANQDSKGAKADIERALKLDPKLFGAYVTLAEILDFDLHQQEQAIDAAKQALRLDPQNATVLALLGHAEMMKGDVSAAAVDFDRAIALSPADAHGWAYRGKLKERNKDYAGALADYDRALAVAPTTQLVYLDRGRVRLMQHDFAGALADFNALDAPAAQTGGFFFERGTAEQHLGKFDRAIEDYRRALEKSPEPTVRLSIHLNRAVAYIAAGENKVAISDCDAALALDSQCNRAYLNRAVAHRRLGQLASAKADLDRAKQTGAKDGELLKERANQNWALEEYAAMIEDLNQLMEKTPDAEAYELRGLAEFSLGQWQNAAADFNACLTLAPPGTHQHYTQFFALLTHRSAKVGDRDKDFAAVIAAWPDSWTKTIGRYLSYELNEDELLAAAKRGVTPTAMQRRCEADFYIGMTHLIAGDKTTAEDFFEKCLQTGETTYYEYQLARAQLYRSRQDK